MANKRPVRVGWLFCLPAELFNNVSLCKQIRSTATNKHTEKFPYPIQSHPEASMMLF